MTVHCSGMEMGKRGSVPPVKISEDDYLLRRTSFLHGMESGLLVMRWDFLPVRYRSGFLSLRYLRCMAAWQSCAYECDCACYFFPGRAWLRVLKHSSLLGGRGVELDETSCRRCTGYRFTRWLLLSDHTDQIARRNHGDRRHYFQGLQVLENH